MMGNSEGEGKGGKGAAGEKGSLGRGCLRSLALLT